MIGLVTGLVANWRVVAIGGAVLAVLAGGWFVVSRIERGAADRERAAIDRSNRAADDAADAAERPVILCPGTWDRERGRCVD